MGSALNPHLIFLTIGSWVGNWMTVSESLSGLESRLKLRLRSSEAVGPELMTSDGSASTDRHSGNGRGSEDVMSPILKNLKSGTKPQIVIACLFSTTNETLKEL